MYLPLKVAAVSLSQRSVKKICERLKLSNKINCIVSSQVLQIRMKTSKMSDSFLACCSSHRSGYRMPQILISNDFDLAGKYLLVCTPTQTKIIKQTSLSFVATQHGLGDESICWFVGVSNLSSYKRKLSKCNMSSFLI